MFQDHLREAVAAAAPHALDDLAVKATQVWANGQLTDDELEEVCGAIQARRDAAKVAREVAALERPRSLFAPRARQRVPKNRERIERRRMLGTSSTLPPALRARFTMGEVAVLTVVLGDVRAKGFCDCSMAEIGARAGASYSLVRNAIRMAETLGLIAVTQRPQKGAKNLTNVIRVVSRELSAWLAKGPRRHRVQKEKPLQRTVSRVVDEAPRPALLRVDEIDRRSAYG